MSDEIIPLSSITPTAEAFRIGLTQGPSGHVHSPWFSFPIHDLTCVHEWGGRTNDILAQAARAFAGALNLDRYEVMISSRENLSEKTIEFRLGTARPVDLPKPLKPPRSDLAQNAIDI